MDEIRKYEFKYDMESGNSFASASYGNSIKELIDALDSPVDETDCETWGITEEEYFEGIKAALLEKTSELEE